MLQEKTPDFTHALDDSVLEDPLLMRLRDIAGRLMAAERRGHTLQPTALVHEALLRLRAIQPRRELDEGHVLALFAQTMRRVLIDHARHHECRARASRIAARVARSGRRSVPARVLDVHEALTELATTEPRLARLVEMRFFGGFSNLEIARALGVSKRTIVRDWTHAKAKLVRLLEVSNGELRHVS